VEAGGQPPRITLGRLMFYRGTFYRR
jgi:hypothetical protein